MTLFKKEAPLSDFNKLNKLIYGFPKSGKTTFASVMRNQDDKLEPLFIATEKGHGALNVFRQAVTHWQGFVKLTNVIAQNATQIQQEHSSIVIDLASDLDVWCADYIAKSQNVDSLADLEYGKGWQMFSIEFAKPFKVLFDILPVTFIAHSQEKELMWQNEKIKTQAPELSKRAMSFINGKVDIIMWIAPANSRQEKPHIIMKPSTTCIAGSRFKQIVNNYVFDTDNPESTYQAIATDFANAAG